MDYRMIVEVNRVDEETCMSVLKEVEKALARVKVRGRISVFADGDRSSSDDSQKPSSHEAAGFGFLKAGENKWGGQ